MAKGTLTKDRQYHGQREAAKTANIMARGKLTKDRLYHGQRETDKDSQYHGQRETDKRQTISWPKGN